MHLSPKFSGSPFQAAQIFSFIWNKWRNQFNLSILDMSKPTRTFELVAWTSFCTPQMSGFVRIGSGPDSSGRM